MDVNVYELVHFILMAMLGAFTAELVWAKGWKDLKSFECVRHVMVGAIVGFVYYFLHVQHGYPDMVVSYAMGWFGKDAIEGIVEKFRQIFKPSTGEREKG